MGGWVIGKGGGANFFALGEFSYQAGGGGSSAHVLFLFHHRGSGRKQKTLMSRGTAAYTTVKGRLALLLLLHLERTHGTKSNLKGPPTWANAFTKERAGHTRQGQHDAQEK